MKVLYLQFNNYRNLVDNYIQPCEKVNVIYGDNAQGKTNLLEALWLFCGGHSFRGAKDNELIKFGADYADLKIKFFSEEREQTSELKYFNGKKEVKINEVAKKSSSALVGKYSAVVFSPEHLTLVKNGPQIRRNFIDSALCRQKVKNALLLSKYNQTLNQRNALLKDIRKHRELRETLPIWDETLCSLGALLIRERLEYINQLCEYAKNYHSGISDNREELLIKYSSNCDYNGDETVSELNERLSFYLKKSRDDDIYTGCTNTGPHRDDIDIIINGVKAKTFGSQGQQRSAVLSLKLAEAEIISDKTGEKPIILLDDVLSELDNKRQDFLLNKTEAYQVFITCCEKSNKQQLKNGRIIYIKNGEAVTER